MARANHAYTAEYDYVSPSMYAYARATAQAQEEARTYPQPNRQKKEPLKVNKASRHAERAILSKTMTIKVIACMALIGLLLIGIVWTNARKSSINYEINQLKSRNAALENEIELLTIEIESSNNVKSVENYATTVLGLRYPDTKQCIYIEKNGDSELSLADTIKAKAYKKEKSE